LVLAGDNYTGFAARGGGKRERETWCHERRENEENSRREREVERERDRQMPAEVEFIGR